MDVFRTLFDGAVSTLSIAAVAGLLAVAVGALAGLARMSRVRIIRWLAGLYVEVFRGTSALVQLFYVVFVLPLLGLRLPLYVAAVMGSGAAVLLALFPASFPQPWLLAGLIIAACLTASWKVNLLMPLGSGSTLSVSCAAKLAALLLLGPGQSVIVASAAAITQCTYKVRQPYPIYRTVFSVAAEALTMGATGLAFLWLGAGILVVALPTVLVLLRDDPDHGAVQAGASAASAGPPMTFAEMAGHASFWWLALSFFVCGVTTSGLIDTHFIPYAQDHHVSSVTAATAFETPLPR